MNALLEDVNLGQLFEEPPTPCEWFTSCGRDAEKVGLCPRCRDVTLLCAEHAAWVCRMCVVDCSGANNCRYQGHGASFGWRPL